MKRSGVLRRSRLGAAIVMLALSASSAGAAATPERKCQGGKNELAGKFAACRAKAEKKLALTGDLTAYGAVISKCETKYASGWTKHENKAVAAGGTCIDIVAENDLRDFLAACTDAVAVAAGGGLLPAVVYCGNGAIDMGEDCDLGTLNGATCATEGFAGGVLACTNGCAFDTSDCYNERWVDNADGTITDNHTGLMWEKKVKLGGGSDLANLQDADNSYRWAGACTVGGASCQPDAASAAACLSGTQGNPSGACSECVSGMCAVSSPGVTVWQWLVSLNAANFGGHDDWRLAKKWELATLIDDADGSPPAVDVKFQGASCGTICTDVTSPACACTASFYYWSASTHAPSLNVAWIVEFGGGGVGAADKGNGYPVRAVRGGL